MSHEEKPTQPPLVPEETVTASVTERAYLHTNNWAGYFAFPVEVLSRGKKFARVRLLHKTHIGTTHYPRGTIKSRVPLWSLSEHPSRYAHVSQGGGRFR